MNMKESLRGSSGRSRMRQWNANRGGAKNDKSYQAVWRRRGSLDWLLALHSSAGNTHREAVPLLFGTAMKQRLCRVRWFLFEFPQEKHAKYFIPVTGTDLESIRLLENWNLAEQTDVEFSEPAVKPWRDTLPRKSLSWLLVNHCK